MTFYLIAGGFHRTFATGAACQQRTLTPPDTWSCPTLGLASVLMLIPISPELVLFLDFWVSNIPRYFCFCFFKFWIFILWQVFILFVKKCCIDHLLCMDDVFRLSGTTDYCNFCYRWRQILAIGTEVLIFELVFLREWSMF